MRKKVLIFAILITALVINSQAFSAQYTFTPRVSSSVTYTDNVFLTDDNKEDDVITDVTAGGTLSIFGKTSGMDLSFDPGYVWYHDNSRDDTWRLPLNLGIYSNFSRQTSFNFFNRLLRTEDPQDNRPVVNEDTGRERAPGDSTVRRGRGWYFTNFASARIDHQMGSDDAVFGQFIYSLRREEDGGGNENDRYAPSAGLTYWFGPRWGTTVDATYTRALFDNSTDFHDIAGIFQLNRRFTRHFFLFGRYGYAYRDNDDDGDDDTGDDLNDYQVHAPSVGFNYELAEDSRISLGLGYYYQDIDGGDNEQGPFVNADLFKRWNYQRWFASLLGQAGLDRNDFGNERLGFEYFAGITGIASYRFTRYFSGNVNARYRYSDFINEDREDHRYTLGAGLGWLPTRWMTLSLDYTFNKLDSDATRDFDENRVWLRVILQPDRPWRF